MQVEDALELEPQAFCYWLQGAIEIGELQSFDIVQAMQIVGTGSRIKTHTVFTLQSLMLLGTLPPPIAFVHVQRELQRIFIHDIDNNYEGDQEFLHLVHGGEEEVL
jgi:hypothetical protein